MFTKIVILNSLKKVAREYFEEEEIPNLDSVSGDIKIDKEVMDFLHYNTEIEAEDIEIKFHHLVDGKGLYICGEEYTPKKKRKFMLFFPFTENKVEYISSLYKISINTSDEMQDFIMKFRNVIALMYNINND